MVKIMVDDVFLNAISPRFGSVKGDSRWIPWLDVNFDGKIDITDFAYFAKYYGGLAEIYVEKIQGVYDNVWTWITKYDPYVVWSGIGGGAPHKDHAAIETAFREAVESATGGFILEMVDKGYDCTISDYSIAVESIMLDGGQHGDREWVKWQTRITFKLYFATNIPVYEESLAAAILAAVVWFINTCGIKLAIMTVIILIGLGLYKMSTETSEVEYDISLTNPSDEPMPVHTPDCETYVIPPGGDFRWKYKETTEKPSNVMRDLGYAALTIGGVLGGIYVLSKIWPRESR